MSVLVSGLDIMWSDGFRVVGSMQQVIGYNN